MYADSCFSPLTCIPESPRKKQMPCLSPILRFKRIELCEKILESESAPDYVKIVATKYRASLLIDQQTEEKTTLDLSITRNEKILAGHAKTYTSMVENESTTLASVYQRRHKDGASARIRTEWPGFIKRLRENQRIRKKLEHQLTIDRADSLKLETTISNLTDIKTKITPVTIRSVQAVNKLFADVNANFGAVSEQETGEEEKIYVKNQEMATKAALSSLPDQDSEDEAFKNELIRMMLPALLGESGGENRRDERDDDEVIAYEPQAYGGTRMSDRIYGSKKSNGRGAAVILNEYEVR